MVASHIVICLHVLAPLCGVVPASADQQFEQLAAQYVDQFPALSPVTATQLGDHRYDSELDELTELARKKSLRFHRDFLKRVIAIDAKQLARANQVDHALLEHDLRAQLWQIEVSQEWAWNPLIYTELAGGAIYGLMAREFAPLPTRLGDVADRLTKFPQMFEQIRAALDPRRVPRIHAETAIKQNRGVVSILANMVEPHLGQLGNTERTRLIGAMEVAKQAVEEYQSWLETDLLPKALGDFRIGKKRFDEKLAFTLQTPLSRRQIRERAENELRRVRAEMYQMAADVYRQKHTYTQFPENPSPEFQQAIIRAALEMAYEETPAADQVVEAARKSLALTTSFVRDKDLITIPADPLEIIVMPEFQRGVSLAYCDSPGPLDVGQKTFYAVAPLPKNWNQQQIRSFLREYNLRSIHDLTVHEAMPGHFVQLAHSNRYPGKLRAVLASGVFIEGWAVYTEQMMADEGLLDGDPLMGLIARKWYLRGIANAILDQAIHTEGISREQAMRLMMEDTFQEEREAAAKWIRAQLTSTQLSTYFVGYLEHADLRRETEQAWSDEFRLKTYHDKVLSFGSPPVKYVRALLLDKEIPR
ncbi:MAG TPA: DUF885 domain-containing protein [Pirellulaceae bacterium]|nr:DUF885 domain-containing protein [Pirellulaceae bacterium]